MFRPDDEKTVPKDFIRETATGPRIPTYDLRDQSALATIKANGIDLNMHQTLQFVLAENPSTGYSWELDKAAARGLWTADEEYVVAPQREDGRMMVGVPGVKKITITVGDQIGRSMFRAVYARPWEFKGFSANFDESQVEQRNLMNFQINVVQPPIGDL